MNKTRLIRDVISTVTISWLRLRQAFCIIELHEKVIRQYTCVFLLVRSTCPHKERGKGYRHFKGNRRRKGTRQDGDKSRTLESGSPEGQGA